VTTRTPRRPTPRHRLEAERSLGRGRVVRRRVGTRSTLSLRAARLCADLSGFLTKRYLRYYTYTYSRGKVPSRRASACIRTLPSGWLRKGRRRGAAAAAPAAARCAAANPALRATAAAKLCWPAAGVVAGASARTAGPRPPPWVGRRDSSHRTAMLSTHRRRGHKAAAHPPAAASQDFVVAAVSPSRGLRGGASTSTPATATRR